MNQSPKQRLSEQYKTFGKRRSLRLLGFDYAQPFICYHVIIGTYDAQPLLNNADLNADLNEELIASLRIAAERYGYLVLAYCIMPDHVHLLLQAVEGCQSLEKFVGAWKQWTTRVYWKQGGKGKLWQRGFYERILRKGEDVASVCDYIWSNPTRAGLVDDPNDYPWLGHLHEPVT